MNFKMAGAVPARIVPSRSIDPTTSFAPTISVFVLFCALLAGSLEDPPSSLAAILSDQPANLSGTLDFLLGYGLRISALDVGLRDVEGEGCGHDDHTILDESVGSFSRVEIRYFPNK
jgi:hypothetical protein